MNNGNIKISNKFMLLYDIITLYLVRVDGVQHRQLFKNK